MHAHFCGPYTYALVQSIMYARLLVVGRHFLQDGGEGRPLRVRLGPPHA